METLTKDIQNKTTPSEALNRLKEGNKRFVSQTVLSRNFSEQVQITSNGQAPFAVVLGCIDSRAPLELIFDQGVGDIFGARVAGNIINEDVLGSLEYSCKVAGSKLIVVLGHTKCGAVTAACNNVELGNVTALLNKIKPAVNAIGGEMTLENIEAVAIKNVELSIEQIKKESPILAEMEQNDEIKIIGASYSVETGEVTFL
ncbi:MAG: carbonic anhydrase [Flavobacteriales bacterium]|nr:MAG: carbonic anhydrase [Flavobacteriales bacterium]